MPKRESAPIGAPIWIDLFSSDPAKTRAFYGELFGWTSSEPNEDFGGYFNFTKDGSLVAGGMKQRRHGRRPRLLDRLPGGRQRRGDRGRRHGPRRGRDRAAPWTSPTWAAWPSSPTPAAPPSGCGSPAPTRASACIAEPGAPAWFELHTRDYDASVQFYKDVFGWDANTMSDTPISATRPSARATPPWPGSWTPATSCPKACPAHWAVYFAVADTDAAVKTSLELGGSVIQPAEDTPYGRLAMVADPTGAPFRLVAN